MSSIPQVTPEIGKLAFFSKFWQYYQVNAQAVGKPRQEVNLTQEFWVTINGYVSDSSSSEPVGPNPFRGGTTPLQGHLRPVEKADITLWFMTAKLVIKQQQK